MHIEFQFVWLTNQPGITIGCRLKIVHKKLDCLTVV